MLTSAKEKEMIKNKEIKIERSKGEGRDLRKYNIQNTIIKEID